MPPDMPSTRSSHVHACMHAVADDVSWGCMHTRSRHARALRAPQVSATCLLNPPLEAHHNCYNSACQKKMADSLPGACCWWVQRAHQLPRLAPGLLCGHSTGLTDPPRRGACSDNYWFAAHTYACLNCTKPAAASKNMHTRRQALEVSERQRRAFLALPDDVWMRTFEIVGRYRW